MAALAAPYSPAHSSDWGSEVVPEHQSTRTPRSKRTDNMRTWHRTLDDHWAFNQHKQVKLVNDHQKRHQPSVESVELMFLSTSYWYFRVFVFFPVNFLQCDLHWQQKTENRTELRRLRFLLLFQSNFLHAGKIQWRRVSQQHDRDMTTVFQSDVSTPLQETKGR